MAHGRVFSIGRAIAYWWRPAYPLLPWALSSALLTVAGLWDYWTRDLPPDLIVLGLAAYELMVGLLESVPRRRPVRSVSGDERTLDEPPSTTLFAPTARPAARARRAPSV